VDPLAISPFHSVPFSKENHYMKKRFLKWAVVALTALVLAPPGAQAGSFLTPFDGNTFMLLSPSTPRVDGTVSFAVYHNDTKSNWVTDLGLTGVATALKGTILSGDFGGSIATNAEYVYFYQVTNDGVGTNTLHRLDLLAEFGLGAYTSFGFLNKTVFHDGAPVGPTSGAGANPRLGNDLSLPDTDLVPPTDGVPSVLGNYAGAVTFTKSTVAGDVGDNAANPLELFFENDHVEFGWGETTARIGAGEYSSVVFVTSEFGPYYGEGVLENSGSAVGDIPLATPEPTSMALMLFGAFGFGGYAGWRKLRRKANA
jgi:hypothetical protein